MKILETQSAMLSNYEVLTHLEDMRARYNKLAQTRGGTPMKSGNLETVMKEALPPSHPQSSLPPTNPPPFPQQLLDYLHTPPSPLRTPHAYAPHTIPAMLAALRPYQLEKPEFLMILNLRPATTAELDVVVEEMDQRFGEAEVEAILGVVKGVLGGVGGEGQGEG
ncbi:MAG: hypothetical protein M1839_000567 [Geoglossum umbratile]|nr:MAG: hypothetical protein M1839_000567 [Geoglossum umbratile]